MVGPVTLLWMISRLRLLKVRNFEQLEIGMSDPVLCPVYEKRRMDEEVQGCSSCFFQKKSGTRENHMIDWLHGLVIEIPWFFDFHWRFQRLRWSERLRCFRGDCMICIIASWISDSPFFGSQLKPKPDIEATPQNPTAIPSELCSISMCKRFFNAKAGVMKLPEWNLMPISGRCISCTFGKKDNEETENVWEKFVNWMVFRSVKIQSSFGNKKWIVGNNMAKLSHFPKAETVGCISFPPARSDGIRENQASVHVAYRFFGGIRFKSLHGVQ